MKQVVVVALAVLCVAGCVLPNPRHKADQLLLSGDYAGAIPLYEKLAAGGDYESQMALPVLYTKVSPPDELKAIYWQREAAMNPQAARDPKRGSHSCFSRCSSTTTCANAGRTARVIRI